MRYSLRYLMCNVALAAVSLGLWRLAKSLETDSLPVAMTLVVASTTAMGAALGGLVGKMSLGAGIGLLFGLSITSLTRLD